MINNTLQMWLQSTASEQALLPPRSHLGGRSLISNKAAMTQDFVTPLLELSPGCVTQFSNVLIGDKSSSFAFWESVKTSFIVNNSDPEYFVKGL